MHLGNWDCSAPPNSLGLVLPKQRCGCIPRRLRAFSVRERALEFGVTGGPRRAFGLFLAVLVLVLFGRVMFPVIEPGEIPGPPPDAPEYVHLSASLLHGSYLVDYD